MLAGLGAGMSEAIIAVTPSETIKQVYSPDYIFLAYLEREGGGDIIQLDLVIETGRKKKLTDRYGIQDKDD